MRRNVFGLVILSLLVQGTSLKEMYGLTQKKSPETILQNQVYVALKLVQVAVTGKVGEFVTDLAKSDFEVYDNGEMKTITEFEKHFINIPNKAEREEPTKISRKYFIFIDNRDNDSFGLIKSIRAAVYFIDHQLKPGDEVGILSYNQMTGLQIQEYLTTDLEKIRSALMKTREIRPYGDYVDATQEREEKEIEKERGLGPQRETAFMNVYIRTEVWGLNRFARKSKDFSLDVTDLAKALRNIPGTKNIIFFSAGNFSEVEVIGKEFAASNSPVYVVNSMKSHAAPQQKANYVEGPLKSLAELSGGNYFDNVDDYQVISKDISGFTGNYYVLGYYISETWDGAFHKISVKTKREGYTVHTQEGYYSPKPFNQLSDMEKYFQLVDLAFNENPYSQTPLRLSQLALPYFQLNKSDLILISELHDYDLFDFIEGKTEVITLIFDQSDNVVDSSRGELDFSKIRDQNIYPYMIFPVISGHYKCRVVIRNLATGKAAVASSTVNVVGLPGSKLTLWPALFFIPEKKASYLRFVKVEKESQSPSVPSLNKYFPFISNSHCPLFQDLDKNVSKLLAIIRYSVRDVEAPNVLLSASLTRKSTKEETPLTIKILSSKEENRTAIIFIEIQLPSLQADAYVLGITAEEIAVGLIDQASYTFIVR